MKPSTRILLAATCTAALTMIGGTAWSGGGHGGSHSGGHSSFQHNQHNGGSNYGANTSGASKRPKSFAQPKGTVVRDHGAKQPTPGRTVCHHHQCYTDHRTGGGARLWRPNTQGPAGGPNNRKPPS